jgi:hypothetical protein
MTNIISNAMFYIAVVLILVACFTFATNILVQLIKQFTYNYVPTQIIAVLVAEIIVILTLVIGFQIMAIPILWYYVVGAVFLGLFVSYAAIFGFDNIYKAVWEYVKIIRQIIADFISSNATDQTDKKNNKQ